MIGKLIYYDYDNYEEVIPCSKTFCENTNKFLIESLSNKNIIFTLSDFSATELKEDRILLKIESFIAFWLLPTSIHLSSFSILFLFVNLSKVPQQNLKQIDIEFITSVYITVLEFAKTTWQSTQNTLSNAKLILESYKPFHSRICKPFILTSFLQFADKKYNFDFLCKICFFGIFIIKN